MLNSDDFNKMVTRYCSEMRLRNLDFWEVYIPSCTYEIEEYVKYRIEAQHKKYLKVEQHQIKMDTDKSIHEFVIVELTSDAVVRMIQEEWYELAESDIEEIKLGLDNSHCEMPYYIIEYYFYSGSDSDCDYYHDEALWLNDVWINHHYIETKWNIFTDKQEAINWIYENYLEDELVVEEELS